MSGQYRAETITTNGEKMKGYGPQARPEFRSIDRATRWSGVLLCWSHGAAMLGTAAEAFFHPTADWWPLVWPGAWLLTGALLLSWAALRARQRHLLRNAAQAEGDETCANGADCGYGGYGACDTGCEPPAYGRAA
ncbi:hypothetical protein [Streptomyces sp. NPDC007346]|uniref:hypothetical protein n=1 Tax=Streptomyces sp. NPDC007346 TaxID=3154682 RepID=UPI003453B081